MVCNSRFHFRSNAQGQVNSPEVVMHEVKRHRPTVIVQLLRERAGPRVSEDGYDSGADFVSDAIGGSVDSSTNF
jgi:hypothetical protein